MQNDAAEVKDDVKADNFDFALRHRRDMGKIDIYTCFHQNCRGLTYVYATVANQTWLFGNHSYGAMTCVMDTCTVRKVHVYCWNATQLRCVLLFFAAAPIYEEDKEDADDDDGADDNDYADDNADDDDDDAAENENDADKLDQPQVRKIR